MKDLSKVFIDLSKLSEEQIKALPQILEKAGESIFRSTQIDLENGDIDRGNILEFYLGEWINSNFNEPTAANELTYPEFIKLFEGGEGEILPDVAYWRNRCLLAEKCLSVSPCDPDITNEQIKAHKAYNQFLETFGNKD